MSRSRIRQAGTGLVEIMVSLGLSLLVTYAATSVYLGQKQTSQLQQDVSAAQETGRAAAELLARQIRMLAYKDKTQIPQTYVNPYISGTNDSGINSSDAFTVAFEGSSFGVAAGTADGSIVDCRGRPVPTRTDRNEVFEIGTDAGTGRVSLQCRDADGIFTLVAGVESMQVLLGYDENGINSTSVWRAIGLTATFDGARSIMVSLVVASAGTSAGKLGLAARTFNHFGPGYAPANVAPAHDLGAVYVAPDDGRVRRQLTFVVGFRNRLQ